MVGHLWMVGVGAPCCFCSFGGGGCCCVVVHGLPLVGMLLSLSIYLPHCWQQHGTWKGSSEGEGGGYLTMMGTVYLPVAKNSQTVMTRYIVTVCFREVDFNQTALHYSVFVPSRELNYTDYWKGQIMAKSDQIEREH